ncbi:MAG: 50S ribosomal protein L3 [Patescibacteria group bacterium]|jgi:large subunit ribosomal protein L3
MISGFIAKKQTMSNQYSQDGKRMSVTVLKAEPLRVTQLKSDDKDGYTAVQIAFGQRKRQSKAIESKLKKVNVDGIPKGFKEFNILNQDDVKIGSEIKVDSVFSVGDIVNVTGTSKGRGFAGVIKRHNFQRQPVTGGQSDRTRAPGSIGAQTPGKVLKGKKMPGHLGNATKTVTNLKVISVDPERNEIVISGSVPGARNSWVTIKKAK